MNDFLKKYGWIIFILLLVVIGWYLFKRKSTSTTNGNTNGGSNSNGYTDEYPDNTQQYEPNSNTYVV